MEEIIKGNMSLIHGLEALCPSQAAVRHCSDMYGNPQHWFTLSTPELITNAAALLKDAKARLCMISGYTREQKVNNPDDSHGICYHFDVQGIIYNLTILLSKEYPTVPSITKWFFNADWHEREMMELVGVPVKDQPTPERLFLDDNLDAGVLSKMVPLSVMMNGATSTDLWEHVLSEKGAKQ